LTYVPLVPQADDAALDEETPVTVDEEVAA